MSEYYDEVLSKMKTTERYSSRPPCLREYLPGHCFALIELTEIIAHKYNLKLDIDKAKSIAQNHDVGEYLKGDIDAGKIIHGKVSEEEKYLQELAAWDKISKILPKELFEQKFLYWQSFEKLDCIEAKYVRALDNLEATLHMAKIGFEGFKNKQYDSACGFDEKDYDLTAKYADKSFQRFINEAMIKENPGDLIGFLGELKKAKSKLKEIYEKVGAEWKEEYNYGME